MAVKNKICGIYKITNITSGKFYIGMSNNIMRRFQEHKTPKNINNRTTNLAKAIRKYGLLNFRFEILDECEVVDLCNREIHYIKTLKPYYNMNDGGFGNSGRPLCDKLKKRLSLAAKLQWQNITKEQREFIISNNLCGPKVGHTMSSETRKKISEKLKGHKALPITLQRRSASQKISMVGNRNGNKRVILLYSDIEVEFKSVKEAARAVYVHPSGITSVLKGRGQLAGGYNWKYSTNK